MNIGGSRAFSLADAAAYTGVSGGTDKFKQVYNTFGQIDVEAFPEVIPSYAEYSTVTNWSFLKRVYGKLKSSGSVGAVSKTDFSQATKGETIGDANYSIQFELGSATISPASYAVLDKILGQLSVASNTFVEVGGHTDNTGNPEANQTLSEQRANAVRQYLASKDDDLTDDKLSSKGYGQSSPLPNTLPSDGKNRRVEIKLYRVNQ